MAIDGSGNIVVTGSSDNLQGLGTGEDMAIWRFTNLGVPDDSFGQDGYASHDGAAGCVTGNGDYGLGIAIDAAGNILVSGGSTGDNASGRADLSVWRYTSDGDLDTTFGGDTNPVDGTPDGFLMPHPA